MFCRLLLCCLKSKPGRDNYNVGCPNAMQNPNQIPIQSKKTEMILRFQASPLNRYRIFAQVKTTGDDHIACQEAISERFQTTRPKQVKGARFWLKSWLVRHDSRDHYTSARRKHPGFKNYGAVIQSPKQWISVVPQNGDLTNKESKLFGFWRRSNYENRFSIYH